MLTSVSKVGALLKLFRIYRPEISLAEITTLLGIPKTTAFELVSTLVEGGFLAKTIRGKYTPSVRMFELGQVILEQMNLATAASEHLRSFSKATGMVAYLSELEQSEIIRLLKVNENPELLTTGYAEVGNRMPAFETAEGWSIASLNETVFSEAWQETTFDKARLEHTVAFIKRNGYFFLPDSPRPGLGTLAAPIIDVMDETKASVSITGPREQFNDVTINKFGRLINALVQRLSELSSYSQLQ